jgi:WD40 repeat protein
MGPTSSMGPTTYVVGYWLTPLRGWKQSMRMIVVVLLVLAGIAPANAGEPTYWQDVRPLLRRHCTVCHSVRTLKEPDVSGGLALDSFAGVMKGAKVPVVVPRKPDESELIRRLQVKDATKRMPLDADPLPDDAVVVLSRWIALGSPEGTRPSEPDATGAVSSVANAAGSDRRRKLDVVLPTRFTPPRNLAAKPIAYNTYVDLVLPAGPLSPVTALAYNPEGALLAVGVYGQVTIWDMKTVAPTKVLTNVLGAVNDLKFSPDGKMLAVAGGQPSARGDLRLFRVNDWSLAATLGGHADVVASVVFSPDGLRLASASFDKTVRVWDIAKRQTVLTLTGHSDFVYAVAWDPKGQWIASASKDRTVKVVDATTGKTRLTLSGMEQDVLAVAASGDGSQVISSGYESQIYWWNAKTGERTRRITGHDVAVHELCVSRDGKLLASAGGDKTLRLWNGANGQGVKNISVGSLTYAAAISPDGKRAVAGSFDGVVRLYDVATAKPVLTLVSGGATDWAAVTPEGYVSVSDGWSAIGHWRIAGQDLPSTACWAALRNAEAVAKVAAGIKVPEPSFKR